MPITLPIPNSPGQSGYANSASTYYSGTNQGEFQFVSLEEVINNFTAAYIGQGKILANVLKGDVSFHAHRALQELHYDTLKSCKSIEIEVCSNLKVPLPHDYVNYSKIAWVDQNGIWRNLYPSLNKTGNPFAVEQTDTNCTDCGDTSDTYQFNGSDLKEQEEECNAGTHTCGITFEPKISGQVITSTSGAVYENTLWGILKAMECSGNPLFYLNQAQRALYFNQFFGAITDWCNCLDQSGAAWNCGNPLTFVAGVDGNGTQLNSIGEFWAAYSYDPTDLYLSSFTSAVSGEFLFDGLVQWTYGPGWHPPTSPVYDADGQDITSNLWGCLPSASGIVDPTDGSTKLTGDIANINPTATTMTASSPTSNSWSNYKSQGNTGVALDTSLTTSPAVDSDTYYNNVGARRGIDPQHAQSNGSYYIDCRNGMIHFSSNVAGKTVVIQYLSDGHGDPRELIVHKFAEEAMYKWIAYGCAQARTDVDPNTVVRLKREKFAETRKAKIRLSNIKIEEISQIFRGKSKFIKH